MRGLDTNVLVRYLVQDDAEQGARATRYIQEASRTGEPCLINLVVLCELVWVLESVYKVSKDTVGTVLEKILMTRQFEVEDKDIACVALRDYRATGVDFADCVIGRKNQALGCDETATFDGALRSNSRFRLL